MDFNQAQALIFSRLPMFSRIGSAAVKYGLRNIRALCEVLDHPERKFKSIHVAGTNGKGSTCHMLAAAFMKAGYKTGLYTSPHLTDIRERVRINGDIMSKEAFVAFIELIGPHIDVIKPSYFELNVAMAFYVFAEEKVDIAIIETGLGGRLDSTNVIDPELSVITQIALDHTDVLGDTLEEIAGEKAGIIKENTPVVIGKSQIETEKVFVQAALARKAPIVFADTLFSLVKVGSDDRRAYYKGVNHASGNIHQIDTDLLGDFQADNIPTAWAAVRAMENLGWKIDEHLFFEALRDVKKMTGLRGRWDRYASNIILEVAHNPDGIRQALININNLGAPVSIVYGSVKDKDVAGSVQLLPDDASYYITQASVPRAMPVEELAIHFEQNGKHFTKHVNVATAVEKALNDLSPGAFLLVIGSFFVVGEAYEYLDTRVLSR